MSVSTQLLYPALRLAGILGAAGRGASTSQYSDAFGALNRMLESWSTRRLIIYTIGAARYTLSPSQTSYTIGPTGDFNTTRPIRIDAANIVISGSSENHLPLKILTLKEWEATRITTIPTEIPTALYNDGAHPLSTLYLWGYPTAANDLELFTWSQLTRFLADTDTCDFPPGYEDAIAHNLAVRLCALFRTQCTPDLRQLARESLNNIKAENGASPAIPSADFGASGLRGGGFNYGTGGPA